MKLIKRQLFHKQYNQRNKFSGEEVSSSLRLSRESVVSWLILKANNMWALGVEELQHNNIHASFLKKKVLKDYDHAIHRLPQEKNNSGGGEGEYRSMVRSLEGCRGTIMTSERGRRSEHRRVHLSNPPPHFNVALMPADLVTIQQNCIIS